MDQVTKAFVQWSGHNLEASLAARDKPPIPHPARDRLGRAPRAVLVPMRVRAVERIASERAHLRQDIHHLYAVPTERLYYPVEPVPQHGRPLDPAQRLRF